MSWRLCGSKVPNGRGNNATIIHLSTALQDHAYHILHWQAVAVRLACLYASGSKGTCTSAVCVSFCFYEWKMNNYFTCRAWWPRTVPVLLCISFTFCFYKNKNATSSHPTLVDVLYLCIDAHKSISINIKGLVLSGINIVGGYIPCTNLIIFIEKNF